MKKNYNFINSVQYYFLNCYRYVFHFKLLNWEEKYIAILTSEKMEDNETLKTLIFQPQKLEKLKKNHKHIKGKPK